MGGFCPGAIVQGAIVLDPVYLPFYQQFPNSVEKSHKGTQLIPLKHKYMSVHFPVWFRHFNKNGRA
jgi:hypothetical protein